MLIAELPFSSYAYYFLRMILRCAILFSRFAAITPAIFCMPFACRCREFCFFLLLLSICRRDADVYFLLTATRMALRSVRGALMLLMLFRACYIRASPAHLRT